MLTVRAGWGRTARDKTQWGVSGSTAQLLADIDELLQRRLDAHPGLPLFLLGHSMGGGTALTYAHAGALRGSLAGVAVWSPLIEPAAAVRPSRLLVAAGRLGARLLPNAQRVEALDPATMSRDPAVCAAFARDPLCHNTGTLLGMSEMLARGECLARADTAAAFAPDLPVLVCHGSADKVADCAASRRFVAALAGADTTFREYAGWRHKLHAEPEPDRTRFATEMVEWIRERAGANAPAGGTPKL